jgi:FkbM family methyltransferase
MDFSFYKDWAITENMVYNPNDQYIGNTLNSHNVWEPYMFPYLTVSDKKEPYNIIDVGANIGTHTIFMARTNENCTVHSFEPQMYQYTALNTNLLLNKLHNVVTYKLALGDTNTKLRFPECYIKPGRKNFGGASLIPNYHGVTNEGEYKAVFDTSNFIVTHSQDRNNNNNKGEIVTVVPLDDINIENVKLIKIDVEGFEYEFLKGAIHTIQRDKPDMIIEIHHDDKEDKTKKLLEELGYTYKHIPWAPNWDYFCKFVQPPDIQSVDI